MSYASPSQAGFIEWCRTIMQAPVGAIPDNSEFFTYAYDISIATVNRALVVIPPIYTLAVYNLGGDILINITPDIPPSTFFADLRAGYKVFDFVAGVVTSAGDNGTSTGIQAADFTKELTLANLQNLKTPYGRQYLAWAQSYGTIWGLS